MRVGQTGPDANPPTATRATDSAEGGPEAAVGNVSDTSGYVRMRVDVATGVLTAAAAVLATLP